MNDLLRQAAAVARKDFASELRTRYALNALGMFIVVTVGVIAFSLGVAQVRPPVSAALVWIAMFFSAISGLGRSFVSEEERGTSLLLRLTLRPAPVYIGKLFVNLVIALVSGVFIAILYQLLLPGVSVADLPGFFFAIVLTSVGFAAVLTIIAAIIARTASKGALYPVLSFPLILPLLLLGVGLLEDAIDGAAGAAAEQRVLMLGLYTAALVALSYVMFDFLWKD